MQRCQYARVGSENGLLMSRTAFAVMVKYSQLSDEFEEMIQEVDILCGQVDPLLSAQDKLKQIRLEIKDDDNFKKLLQQWQQASKIRIWIVEKKNNQSEKLERTQREAFIKAKKEKLQKAIKEIKLA